MRIAEKSRDTKETKIYEKINLDGNGNSEHCLRSTLILI